VFHRSIVRLQRHRFRRKTSSTPTSFRPQPSSPPTTNASASDDDDDFIVETSTPHPEWQPGDLQPHPFLDLKALNENDEDDENDNGDKTSSPSTSTSEAEKHRQRVRAALLAAPRHFVDPSKTPGSALYPLTISAVVPRPIALVSTLSPPAPDDDEKTGNQKRTGNLSPFSYCGLLAHDPPHIAIGTCGTSGKPDRAKDTQFNILSTKEFVVNIISEHFVEAANHTCGFYDRGIDEMELAGLTPQASVMVAPPRVAEAAVQLECRLVASLPVFSRSGSGGSGGRGGSGGGASGGGGNGGSGKKEKEKDPPQQQQQQQQQQQGQQQQQQQTTTILIGEVVALHVLEAVSAPTADGRSVVVDPRKLRPVCRLGGDTYGTLGRLFDLPRPGKEWQERREATRAAAAK